MSSAPANPSSLEPIIDAEAIENLRALNPDDDSFLKEIIGIFIEDTPARIAELRQAHAAGDVATFSRAAHSIKGSSSNLGAARLRTPADSHKNGLKNQSQAGLEAGIPEVEAAFTTAKAELERLA